MYKHTYTQYIPINNNMYNIVYYIIYTYIKTLYFLIFYNVLNAIFTL